jgi:hypothetical protein
MSYQDCWDRLESELNNLKSQGFVEVEPPDCVDLVLLKQTRLGPRVKAVINTTNATLPFSAGTTYDRFRNWAKNLLANEGMGVLVFLYAAPPIEVVEEIVKLGRGFLGGAQIVASAYDLDSCKFWLWDPMRGSYSTKKFP